jgi:hypothetical protein
MKKLLDNVAFAYALSAVLCISILICVLRLWEADLRVPFSYDGDGLFYGMIIKAIIDNGWYLHNPFLGMPMGLDMYDFPLADSIHLLVIKVISWFIQDYALVLNGYFLLTFLLTTWISLWVLRRFGISLLPAVISSLLFTFLQYHFWRGEAHLFLASYYLIPLVIMVCLWIFMGNQLLIEDAKDSAGQLRLNRPRYLAALFICILTACGGIYYAFFACYFILIAGIYAAIRTKRIRHLMISITLIAVIFGGFVVNVTPSIIYHHKYGRNDSVAQRAVEESEIYALRLTQLVFPVAGHRIAGWNRARLKYDSIMPLVNENGFASLGTAGSAAFLFLLGWGVLNSRRPSSVEFWDHLGVLNLSAFLLGTMGGLGALFAFRISPQIRCYNRISVYIAFFSFFAMAIGLDRWVQKPGRSQGSRYLCHALLVLLLLAGVLDETSKQYVPNYASLKADYYSDAAFVQKIEASVPQNAMIYQLPYAGFPEYRSVHRMTVYEQFRGYLHGKTLRWSYGAMRGREGDRWQMEVAAQSTEDLLETLVRSGFSGIYLDRYGYADDGKTIEAELDRLLGGDPVVSKNQRLVFYKIAQPDGNRRRGPGTTQ